MFMQAWGNYGTVWPVVHQMLGVRPTWAAARAHRPGRPGGPAERGRHRDPPRRREGVRAQHRERQHLHDRDGHLRRPGRVVDYKIGVVVRGGSPTATATLDGAPVTPTVQDTPQGTRYVVPASPGGSHTFVVTNG